MCRDVWRDALGRVILQCCNSESSGGSKDVFLLVVCYTPRAFSVQICLWVEMGHHQ